MLIRPYVGRLTQAELFQVMVCGFTSVAGSTLIGYSMLGIPLKYLLTASIMDAPAAICIAKIMFPETDTPLTGETVRMEKDTESKNIIDAAANGALSGLKLAVNVGALLIAFISLIGLINGILGGVGGWFGHSHLTLQEIFGVSVLAHRVFDWRALARSGHSGRLYRRKTGGERVCSVHISGASTASPDKQKR